MSKANIQLYAENVEIENMDKDMAVTLHDVDLSELKGQVTLSDLLDGWDIADIHDYVTEKLKDA